MARSKYGTPRAKFGEIKIKYGYTQYDGEDLFMCYGGQQGGKRTSRLLMDAIKQKNYNVYSNSYEPSLLDQLDEAGYDTKTLVISVQLKEQ